MINIMVIIICKNYVFVIAELRSAGLQNHQKLKKFDFWELENATHFLNS